MASVSGTFFGLGFRHLLWVVAEGVEFGANRLRRGQFVVGIAVVSDQLAAHFCGAQARVEAVGAELRICLTLAIHDGRDIRQQVKEMDFRALAPAGGEVIDTGDAGLQFMRAFTNGPAAPAQLPLRTPLAACAQFVDGARHKQSSRAALEGVGRVDE